MHGVLFGKIEPVPQAHSRHDADGDFRGGGDEDGDDDDEDRITARISMMMAMAPIWIGSG